jgi:hypothetical protein
MSASSKSAPTSKHCAIYWELLLPPRTPLHAIRDPGPANPHRQPHGRLLPREVILGEMTEVRRGLTLLLSRRITRSASSLVRLQEGDGHIPHSRVRGTRVTRKMTSELNLFRPSVYESWESCWRLVSRFPSALMDLDALLSRRLPSLHILKPVSAVPEVVAISDKAQRRLSCLKASDEN